MTYARLRFSDACVQLRDSEHVRFSRLSIKSRPSAYGQLKKIEWYPLRRQSAGYQVIEKYLKSRRGRTLTLDEVTTVENIVAVIAFTITQMAAIDTAYHSAFPTHA